MQNSRIRAVITASLYNGICSAVAPDTSDTIARFLAFQTLQDVEKNILHFCEQDQVGMVRIIPTGYFNLTYGSHKKFENWTKGIPFWYEEIVKNRNRDNSLKAGKYDLSRVHALTSMSAIQRLPLPMTKTELAYVRDCIEDGLVRKPTVSDSPTQNMRPKNDSNFEELALQSLLSVVSDDPNRTYTTKLNLIINKDDSALDNILSCECFITQVKSILNRYKDRADGRVTFLLALQYVLTLRFRLDRYPIGKRLHHHTYRNINKLINSFTQESSSIHLAFSSLMIEIFERHSKSILVPSQPSEQMLLLAQRNYERVEENPGISDPFYVELWALNSVAWMITPFDIPVFREILETDDLRSLPLKDRTKALQILKFRRITVDSMTSHSPKLAYAFRSAVNRIKSTIDDPQDFECRLERILSISKMKFDFSVEDNGYKDFLDSFQLLGGRLRSLRSSDAMHKILEPAFYNESIYKSLVNSAISDKGRLATALAILAAVSTGILGAAKYVGMINEEKGIDWEKIPFTIITESLASSKDKIPSYILNDLPSTVIEEAAEHTLKYASVAMETVS